MIITGHVPGGAAKPHRASRPEEAVRYAPYQALIEKLDLTASQPDDLFTSAAKL